MSTMLIVIGGLPGTGKTALARGLARALDAVHLRIDTIEQAIRASTMGSDALGAAGYAVGYGVAADNLRLGRTVVADAVNPLTSTRAAWREVAQRDVFSWTLTEAATRVGDRALADAFVA